MPLGEPQKHFDVIRDEFFEKYKEQIEKGIFHTADLDRLRKDHEWLKAFYKHSMENHDKTITMLYDVLLWRKEFEANNLLTPGTFPFSEDLLKKGGMFMRNEDINCIPMLHFLVKTHKKDQFPFNQVCKYITFFFERVYKFNIDDPIVLLFDMSDAGYSNLDMDMIKFVVTCLKTYYPGLIDYMIIYQMPFIFNAAWKIIKNWLPPEAVKLIKFVDKKSIREYVQESQLFVHMGGTDDFKYNYDPKTFLAVNKKPEFDLDNYPKKNEIKSIKSKKNESVASNLEKLDPVNSELDQKTNDRNSESKKDTSLKGDEDLDSKKNEFATKTKPVNKLINGFSNKSFETSNATELSFENALSTPLLSISPGDELLFKVADFKQDITQFIRLTNTSSVCLAYKIKITSPDKFRVKPGTGIIQTSSCSQITINYLKEFQNSTSNHRDKFLILWLPIDEKIQPNELNEFWKQAVQNKLNINEHKVKCIIMRPNEKNASNNNQNLNFSSSSPSFSVNSTSKLINKKFFDYSGKEPVNSTEIDIIENNRKSNSKNTFSSSNSKFDVFDENSSLNQQLTHNDINIKLKNLETNMDFAIKLLSEQNKLNKQNTNLLYLVYFLILLNLIQILFQSNLFTQIVEPYIDYLLFQHRD